jgi:hypothetical protein
MSNLQIVPKNELMGVIEIDGRKYITTQQLYADKKASGMESYISITEFNRAVKRLTTYDEMLALGHIIYAEYGDVQEGRTGADLASVFKSTGYKPVLLIDPTAQQTIEQHLDDEASKISSLGANSLSAAVKTGDAHSANTAHQALGAQGLDPHLLMAQMNQLYAAYCQKEIEAAKAQALATGLDKSLTGSQRNNAKLTREIGKLKEDNHKLNLQAVGQLSHMSIAQFCAAVGVKVTKDSKQLAKKMRLISEQRGIEIKKTVIGNEQWPTMQFQAALLNEFIDDVRAYFVENMDK